MTPVISPWVFYLMPVANKVATLAAIIAGVLVIAAIIAFLVYLFNLDIDEDYANGAKSAAKKLIVPICVSVFIFIATPSSTTITKMLVAQNVTYERVETVTDAVETVYNDIMALFEDGE